MASTDNAGVTDGKPALSAQFGAHQCTTTSTVMGCESLPLTAFSTIGYVPVGVGCEVPVPLKPMEWGLPLALSAMLTLAVRDPVAEGVKVTLIEQLALAATLLPQVFVWAKSPEFVPVSPMLVTPREASPVFESVTVLTALVRLLQRQRPRAGAARSAPPFPCSARKM